MAGRAPDPFLREDGPGLLDGGGVNALLVPNRPRVVALPSRAYASFARQF